MNIFKWIDEYLFGTVEEQIEYEQCEKLWCYIPVSFTIAVVLLMSALIV